MQQITNLKVNKEDLTLKMMTASVEILSLMLLDNNLSLLVFRKKKKKKLLLYVTLAVGDAPNDYAGSMSRLLVQTVYWTNSYLLANMKHLHFQIYRCTAWVLKYCTSLLILQYKNIIINTDRDNFTAQ